MADKLATEGLPGLDKYNDKLTLLENIYQRDLKKLNNDYTNNCNRVKKLFETEKARQIKIAPAREEELKKLQAKK